MATKTKAQAKAAQDDKPKNIWTVRKCVMNGATPQANRVEFQLIVNGSMVVRAVKECSVKQLEAMAADYTTRNVPPPDRQEDGRRRMETAETVIKSPDRHFARSAGLEG